MEGGDALIYPAFFLSVLEHTAFKYTEFTMLKVRFDVINSVFEDDQSVALFRVSILCF